MVHNCTISNSSTNSFSVKCTEGFNGGLPQTFLLEVRETNSQELKANLSSPVPRFSVTNLDSGALYQACVYAYNDKGRSEPLVVQAGTVRSPEKQLTSETGNYFIIKRKVILFLNQKFSFIERPRQPIKLIPMLSVIIAVVAALVIVAVIVMVLMKLQHSHGDDQSKPHVENHEKVTKNIPIQRELRFREGSNVITDEKYPTSPFRKLDPNGDVSESDEKNPDIIPQQITGTLF